MQPLNTQTSDKRTNWFDALPSGVRAFLQVGAVGLIMYLYAMDSKEKTAQITRLQEDTRQQAREDRIMFRETTTATNSANDRRFEVLATRLELNTAEMRRVLDRVTDDQKTIKRDVNDLKMGGPDTFKAPPPRALEK